MSTGVFDGVIGGAVAKASSLPAHVTASSSALATAKALTEISKTTPLQVMAIGDSNHTPGTFMAALWERDNFARLLDEQLAWMRSNTTSVTSEVLGPQCQVIKFSTMGNQPVNSPEDTPWHPKFRRFIGEPRTMLGPFDGPWKTLGGLTAFDNPANSNRMIGYIIDRTSSGQDWERNMDQVAVGYIAGATGQGIAISNSSSTLKADGSAYGGGSYSGNVSAFTVTIKDITAVDISGIPASGWSETDPTCATIKTNILAATTVTTRTINLISGTSGANMPGFLTSWLGGMVAGKKYAVLLTVADGATMGMMFEYLVFRNSTIAGGVAVWDYAYSGNALFHLTWKRYNNDGTPASGFSADPFSGDFQTCCYAASSLASRTLMRAENTYGLTGWFGRAGWSTASSDQHNVTGLHVVVISLSANDVGNSSYMPAASYNYVYNAVQQIVRAAPGCLVIFNLMPCIASNQGGGDTNRDYYYTDTAHAKVRATWQEFTDQIKAAAAQFPANTIVLDYQKFYGNVKPSDLKARIGHFGTYKRESVDPIDPLHCKASTWQLPSAQDISRIFSVWAYA